MSGTKLFLAVVLCLWLASGCQRSVAPQIGLLGVHPDFSLVATVTLALFTNRRGAGIVGFFAGVLQGAMAGANLGAYAISRTLAGFLTGWFNGLDFDGSPTVAALCTVIVTALAQVVFMFVAPTPDIGRFLLATMGMAVYNGVLAIPLYAALRCVLDPPAR